MNIYTVMNNVKDALAVDSTIVGYADTWFDGEISIFIDPPKDEPIGESSNPYIHIHSWFKQAADNQREVIAGFSIDAVIFDSEDKTQAHDNASEIRGTERLNLLVRQINAVIYANKPENSSFAFSWNTDTETLFPLLVAVGDVEFTKRLTSPIDFDDFY